MRTASDRPHFPSHYFALMIILRVSVRQPNPAIWFPSVKILYFNCFVLPGIWDGNITIKKKCSEELNEDFWLMCHIAVICSWKLLKIIQFFLNNPSLTLRQIKIEHTSARAAIQQCFFLMKIIFLFENYSAFNKHLHYAANRTNEFHESSDDFCAISCLFHFCEHTKCL